MNPPPSPGVAARRKGPKTLPKLPLSAFSPPNSSADERFPLPPSPSTVHPESVVDAHVIIRDAGDATLARWKKEAGKELGARIAGLVVSIPDAKLITAINESGLPILSVQVPFSLESTSHDPLPTAALPVSLSTTFSKSSPEAIASLNWALSQGKPVDIDVQGKLSESSFEGFEDLLSKAVVDVPSVPPIVVSSFLPPPHDLSLSIVKLMKHPSYREFQSQTAALSLYANLYIKFLPPIWDAPTPPTPIEPTAASDNAKEQTEWKRRIKMYLGPVMEAFGYQRIIFGSSPSPASQSDSAAGDWYEIARECLAELAVEQEFVDAIFSGNAKKVYGAA